MVNCNQVLFIMDDDFDPKDQRYSGDKYLLKLQSFSVFPNKITQNDVNALTRILVQNGHSHFQILEAKRDYMLDPIREEVDYAYTTLAFNSAMSGFVSMKKYRIYKEKIK